MCAPSDLLYDMQYLHCVWLSNENLWCSSSLEHSVVSYKSICMKMDPAGLQGLELNHELYLQICVY